MGEAEMWSTQPEAVGQVSQCHQAFVLQELVSPLPMKGGLASTGHSASDKRKPGWQCLQFVSLTAEELFKRNWHTEPCAYVSRQIVTKGGHDLHHT